MKDILENPDKPWNWYYISSNPNITPACINAHPDKPWNWLGISRNPNITPEFINANLDKPWDWMGLSSNPNLTLEFVKANPDKDWEWNNIFGNPNTTPEDIEQFMIMPWNGITNIYNNIKKILSSVFGIPFKNYRWNDSYVMNPNLTMAFIRKYHFRFFTWEGVSRNQFILDKQEFELQQYRRHLASYRIQQHWHRIRSDPRHPVGQRRLEREVSALGFV